MANLTESPIYETGIFQLEKSTPAVGGAPVIDNGIPLNGHANAQGLQLANRTAWLKQQIDSGLSYAPLASDLSDQNEVTKGAALVGFDGGTVSDQLLKSKVLNGYAALRSYTGKATRIMLTDAGVGGVFNSLGVVNGYTDDGMTTIISSNGVVYLRQDLFPFLASWAGLSNTGSGANNTAAISAAGAVLSALGGGYLEVGRGNFNLASTSTTLYSNVQLRCQGMKNTTFNVAATASTVLFNIIFASGSFNAGGAEGFSVNNSGVMGTAVIKTPVDAIGFNNAQKWQFEKIGFQGQGWAYYMDIGDCSQGYIRNMEWRGRYIATNTDVGQEASVSIRLQAAKGSVAMDIYDFRSVGVRTFVELGENVEGFSIDKGEATNCWKGVYANATAQKPGGFIGPAFHCNANKAILDLTNRRYMNLSEFQAYRSDTMFSHETEWSAVTLNNCIGFKGVGPMVRNFKPSTAPQYEIKLVNCEDINLESILQGEPGGITQCIYVDGLLNSRIGHTSAKGVTTLLSLAGTVADCTFGPFSGPAVPTTAVVFTGTGIDRSSVKILPHLHTPEYEELSFTTASSDIKNFRNSAKNQKVNLTGAGTFVVDRTISHITALRGDTINLKLVITAGGTKTFNLKNDAGTVLYTATSNASTNTIVNLVIIDNGAGVTVYDAHVSLVA